MDITLDTPSDICALLQAMINALHEDKGLTALTSLLADYLKAGVAIVDMNGTLISDAYCSSYTPKEKNLLREHMVSKKVAEHYKIFQIMKPLDYSGKKAGTLYVARLNAPLTEEELLTVAQITGLFCIQLAQNQKIADIELRLKDNFVEDLISARFLDQESILNRANALNYEITVPHRVLVATLETPLRNCPTGDKLESVSFKTNIVQSIQNHLNKRTKGIAIAGKNEFILLVQLKELGNSITESKVLAEEIIIDVALVFNMKMYIGIGSVCITPDDFSQSYLEAKKALEIGSYMITEGQVRSFEQFKVHALFLSTLKPAELYTYAREQLGALLEYDENHQTDFLKTLQEFLYLRNNVEGTAKSINMSVSGLKYRLQKIEKILATNLKDYKVCFDLQLALVILQLFGEYRAK